jgi:protocatechuate 3,4-dioxygenase beta subunit
MLALLAACATPPPSARATATPATAVTPAAAPPPAAIACSGAPTPAVTEGPYFKAGSPERSSLVEPGVTGTPLVLTGHVLTLACSPIAGAVLDFWQADGAGRYDNAGYRLRGHQATDSNGGYRLETVMPGEYPGRTQHIHVKIQAPGGPVVTSQLFFPDSARNGQDSLFNPALVVRLDGANAVFDFVLTVR